MRLAGSRLALVTRPPERPSLWLELTDEEGRTGLGEASPLPPFSRDDVSACQRALDGVHVRLGDLPDDEPPALAISLVLQAIAPALAGLPSARFAVETAVLDLLARRRGVSIACLLGGAAPEQPVPVNALLVASPAETLAERGLALAAQGYAALKIKLRARDGGGFLRELAGLRELREALPLPFEIRLDPNAAWPEDEARRRLDELARVSPRFIEQPVIPGRLAQLGRCAVPWAADESLADPDEAERLLDAEGCAAFILKLPILGGLLAARALALRAQARGLDVVVTHFFDGPVGLAAAAELARSLPRPPLACGLDPHDRLAAWPDVAVPQLARRAFIDPAAEPGLGLVLPPPGERPWMA
jgi:o-succinylbenzoate synthase